MAPGSRTCRSSLALPGVPLDIHLVLHSLLTVLTQSSPGHPTSHWSSSGCPAGDYSSAAPLPPVHALTHTRSSSPGPPASCSPDWPRGWRTHLPSAALTETRYSWRTGSKGAQPSPTNRCLELAARVGRDYLIVFSGPSNSLEPLVTKQEARKLKGGTSFENSLVLFEAGENLLVWH